MTHDGRGSAARRGTPGTTRRDPADVFTALVRRYERPIFGFIYRMMGSDADDAADLTQETFFKAYRALGRISDDLNAGAWLHRIARNCCLDALRRRRIPSQPWDTAAADAAAGGTDGANPERVALRRETDDGVRAVLGRMSPRSRRALVLRAYGGMSCHEIAVATGVTEGAARAQLFRAREEFRHLWAAE